MSSKMRPAAATCEQAGEREKDLAPAEQIAEHATRSLSEKLAENVA